MQSSRGLLQPGFVVADKYVISRLIGRGGMGAVYVVEHRVTGKKLALKCLLPEHLEHPEFVERFLREAQAAGRIDHRNVVNVFDVGRTGELIYIVMELLDGKPLSELLRAGQLSLEETLPIIMRAMEGVAAAHAVGIVHRDLKPDNILVCVGQSGRLDDPRVLDFGISKLEDDIGKPLTKSGVMLGTPYYMAFEQINSQRDLDQRVDVYAMGVILYEAMAGRVPYVAESVGALAVRMMSGPPTPLQQLRPELPASLAAVVMRSVAKDRDQRYPTMNALIEALKPFAPESASMLMPRGQGTPLGLARGSQPMAALAPSGIDATMPAMPSPVPAPHQPRASVREPGPLATPTGLRIDYRDEERTPGVVDSSRSWLWIVAVGALAVIAAVSLFFAFSDDDAAPAPAAAPPPVPEPEPKAEAKPSSVPATKAEAPVEQPKPSEPVEAKPAVVEPAPVDAKPVEAKPLEAAKAEPKGKARRGKKGRKNAFEEEAQEAQEYVPAGTGMEPAPAPAPATEAAPAPAPAPAPMPEPAKAEAPAEPAPAEPPTE